MKNPTMIMNKIGGAEGSAAFTVRVAKATKEILMTECHTDEVREKLDELANDVHSRMAKKAGRK